jgi:3-oxoacyl-[acyl-carrier-protein] synthase II
MTAVSSSLQPPASGLPSIVITGLGCVLPCGDGIEAARSAWAASNPCFSDLAAGLGTGLAGVCSGFKPAGIIPPIVLRRLDRPSRFAWVAAHQALLDSGLDFKSDGDRIGIAAGTTTGGNEAAEAFIGPYFDRGPEGASPMVFPNCVANAASGHLAIAFGLRGPAITLVDRENATLLALDQAVRWLRTGMAASVLLLGTDGLFPLQIQLLQAVRRMAKGLPRAGAGTGLLPGEGAQAFVLETADHARARGARIRARLGGYAAAAGRSESRAHRREALARALGKLGTLHPGAWIGGASGLATLDAVELPLAAQHPDWPAPRLPKLLWGEFGGSGGQLLAAALLESNRSVLLTAPASAGPQVAMTLEDVQG